IKHFEAITRNKRGQTNSYRSIDRAHKNQVKLITGNAQYRLLTASQRSLQPVNDIINGYMEEPHLWQILAVGMVTHIGAYFFFASNVPAFGSSSATALPRPPTAHTAAAAAANITALLPALPPSSRAS
ncbi:unnamed protein product, partial [Musa textilis]